MRSILHRAVQFFIRKAKGREDYLLDKDIGAVPMVGLLFERFVMCVRGFFVAPFLGNFCAPLFLGRRVKIKSKNKVSIGKGCTIASDVFIDGLSKCGIRIGDNVTIPNNTFIRCTGVVSDIGHGLVIGDGSGLGQYNFINAQGGVFIGNDVIVGPFVKFLAENHNFSNLDVPIKDQGVTRKGITIKDNVWIGASAIILDGVTIESGVVVAAGSIVNRDVPRNAVVAGCPARLIRYRG